MPPTPVHGAFHAEFTSFLDREGAFANVLDPRIRRGTADAAAALDRALAAAA